MVELQNYLNAPRMIMSHDVCLAVKTYINLNDNFKFLV